MPNSTTYNRILSKGIEAELPAISEGKLRFTTDTGRLFLDASSNSRVEITDFVKGYTRDQIIYDVLAPLPKFYLASDTNEIFYFTDSQWKSIRVTEAVNASTANFALTADSSTNASTAEFAYSSISNITRDGLTFTVTRYDNSTFSFDQQDNNSTYTAADGIGIDGSTFYNTGVRNISVNGNNINVNINGSTQDITVPYATNASSASFASTASVAEKDSSGNIISSYYAPIESPAFTGTPTTPDVTSGDKSSKVANTKFVDNAITSAISGITQFDYDVETELPATGTKGVIYLIPSSGGSGSDIYDEYIWLTDASTYEKIGSTAMDLSEYVNATTVTGTGNAITSISKSGNLITFSKDSTFLTSVPSEYATTATYTAGTGIDKTGTEFSVDQTAALNLSASTAAYSSSSGQSDQPSIEANFDFGEVTADSDTYSS